MQFTDGGVCTLKLPGAWKDRAFRCRLKAGDRLVQSDVSRNWVPDGWNSWNWSQILYGKHIEKKLSVPGNLAHPVCGWACSRAWWVPVMLANIACRTSPSNYRTGSWDDARDRHLPQRITYHAVMTTITNRALKQPVINIVVSIEKTTDSNDWRFTINISLWNI